MVRTLLDALPVGSALVITHITQDFDENVGRIEDDFENTGSTVRTRTKAQVEQFFEGLEMLEPGLQAPQHWRPEPAEIEVGNAEVIRDQDVPVWAGVGIKTGA
jgi:S-adenosyl methyltransferase